MLDHRGEPKVAYHHLRRALAPVAVWTTDEGLGGIDVHVANDAADAARAPGCASRSTATSSTASTRPTSTIELRRAQRLHRWDVEALLGRFVDAAWAYRFGPPAHDLIVASLEGEAEDQPGVNLAVHALPGRLARRAQRRPPAWG